jgi:hypothetical protein
VAAAQTISLAIQGSMALMVFCIGLHATLDDLVYLLRKPGLLARSLLSMNVIMPAVAVTIALAFDLDRDLKAVLIALSLSRVAPILPGSQLKKGGRESYSRLSLHRARRPLTGGAVPLTSDQRSPNANSALPAAIATYCLPFTA